MLTSTEDVQAASYYQNWQGMLAPRKTEHGYISAYPTSVDGRIASIDLNGDYGLFVVFAAIENRDKTDTTIPAAGEEPSFVEISQTIGKATGKEINTVEATREQYEAAMEGFPQSAKDDLREMLASCAECAYARRRIGADRAVGYFGKADWRKVHSFLPRKPKTLAEFASTATFPSLQ